MKYNVKRLSDSELAVLAGDGNAAAFEEIYDRHAAGVARALASFAGPDRDLLDDLTQEVYFRVIKGLAGYRPDHPFAHWLFTIALNVGRNYARQKSKVIPVNPADLEDVPAHRDPESEWSGDVAAKTLTRLASRLPEEMRDVVSLRVGAEMSYGEIAEVLGIPEGTARSRMFNAVKTLRARLAMSNQKRRKRK